MIKLMTRDAHDDLKNKADEQNLTLTDENVQILLKDLLTTFDSSRQHSSGREHSGREHAKQLFWLIAGTIDGGLVKFMQLARKIEKRMPDNANFFVRLTSTKR